MLRLLKILLWVLGGLLVLILLFMLALRFTVVREKIAGQASSYLSAKIGTPVRLRGFDLGLLHTVNLHQVYAEDQHGDTLLFAEKLSADLDLAALLKNRIQLDRILVKNVTARVYRHFPDTNYNYSFILSALGGSEPDTVITDTTAGAWVFGIGEVEVENTRLVYYDDFDGIDLFASIGKFSCTFETFDLGNSAIIARSLTLKNSDVRFNQGPEKDTSITIDEASPPWVFGARKIGVTNVSAYFLDVDSSLYGATIGELALKDGKINLGTSEIEAGRVALRRTFAKVIMMPAEGTETPVSESVIDSTGADWKINVKHVVLSDDKVHFEMKGEPAVEGFNPALMRFTGLSLEASGFLMKGDEIGVVVKDLSLKEENGFSLSRLAGRFNYNTTGASVKDLVLITPYSKITKELSVSYKSIDELSENPDRAGFFADIKNTAVGLHDVYYFIPSLSHSLVLAGNEKVYIDADISGSLSRLTTDLVLRWRTSKAAVKGELRALMHPEQFFADLPGIVIRSGQQDLEALLPAGTLPQDICLPDSLSLDANFLGYIKNFNARLALRSSLGHMTADVQMDPAQGNTLVPYTGTVITEGLALGQILSRKELGALTFSIAVKGNGMDTSDFDTDLSLNVVAFEYNKYTYRDLVMKGHLLKSSFDGSARMRDDNVAFDFEGMVNIDPSSPRFRYTLDLKGIDLRKLNLSDEDLRLSMVMNANLVLPTGENPLGRAGIYKLMVMREGKKYRVDSLVLDASKAGEVTTLAVQSEKLKGKATGVFNIYELGPSVLNYVNSHFDLGSAHADTLVKDQAITFDLDLTDPAFLTTGLIPGLERLTPATLKGSFNSDQRVLTADLDLPELVYQGIRIDSVKVSVKGDGSKVSYKTTLAQVSDTSNFKFENISLQGEASNNRMDFSFSTAKDDSVTVLAVAGNILSADSLFTLSLNREAVLNAQKWKVDSANRITFGAGPARISDLVISNGNQMISLNHDTRSPESPLNARFRNFELSAISGMMSHSKPLAGGTVNGELILEEKNGRGVFRSDLEITSLAYKTIPIGDIKLKADNFSDPSVYDMNLSVTGGDNDVQVGGIFRTTSETSLDFNIRIGKLNIAALEAFAGGEVTRLGGWVSGEMKLKGNPEAPKVDGSMQLHNIVFHPKMLDALYRIPGGELTFVSDKIRFNSITLLDSLNNKATVTGFVNVGNLSDPSFDLTLKTKDFIAMNTDKYDNSLYYGKLFLDSDVRLTGSVSNPDVDVKARLGKKSTLTYVKPADEIMRNESKGIVEFSDSLEQYTKIMSRDDSARVKGIIGLSLNADINVDDEVELKVIVDPMAGDSLYIQGGGRLNYSMDRSGNTSLSGKYNITKGGYFLTISDFIKRDFKIEPGSAVSWSGDPLDPYAELKAVYRLKASPVDLMQEQVAGLNETDANKYRKLLNFDVYLIMNGFISSPQISFDIQLAPKDKGAMGGEVNNKLAQLRTDENQLNKQVFALLTLRRFVSENPLESSGGSDFASAGRSSASKILTQQLNTLSDRYVNFVDLDVGVNSYEDYSSGTQQGRTQVEVGVSKQLFNDRVGIRVGGAVDVEGEEASKNRASDLAGNISVDYSLTEDKRYRVRGFRETQYENPLDGEVTKTGVGFVFTRDFNRFKNMFRRSRSQPNGEKKNK